MADREVTCDYCGEVHAQDLDCTPAFCRMSREERAETWRRNPPRRTPLVTPEIMVEEAPEKRKKERKVAAPVAETDLTGKRWDPSRCKFVDDNGNRGEAKVISIVNNKRGADEEPRGDQVVDTMTPEQLVFEFNRLASSDAGRQIRARTVTRFADRDTGVKRVKALASSIRAAKSISTEREEENTMATKAKKVKTTAKKKTATNGAAHAEDKREKISVLFDCRLGTNKEKLVLALNGAKKQVAVPDLLKAVYGSKNENNRGAMAGVIKGVTIAAKKAGYDVKKEKNDEGETTFGLYAKK